MGYSIIIPYRDRKKHLGILLPTLLEKFKGKEYEIIISEQNNNDNFQIACVENVGFKHAKYDTIVFHQVDYVPTGNVSYEVKDQPLLPARKATFVKDDMTPRDYFDIPLGYRMFEKEVESEFYGGVIAMKREQFEKINGLNPLYRGWGLEDEDLRERLKWAGYVPIRNEVGSFICLYHKDNGDMDHQPESKQADFISNKNLYINSFKLKDIGYTNMTWDEEIFNLEDMDNVKWVKSTNYKVDIKNSILHKKLETTQKTKNNDI